MKNGVRQRLIFLIFAGLFVTMGLIGTYRYFMEKRNIITMSRIQGEQSCKLMADLAAPYLLTSDFSGLHSLAQNFMHTPDAQEITIIDRDGRKVIQTARPDLHEKRLSVAPQPVSLDSAKIGEVHLSVYPADMAARLRAYSVSALIEHLFI